MTAISSIEPLAIIGLTGLLGVALSLYMTPIILRAAERYNIVDRPDGGLKTQRQPVAYLGGLAVFLSMLAAIAIVHPLQPKVLAILLAASIVVCFGLVDDLGTLVPKDKLIGQIIAALVLIRAGVQIEIEGVPEPLDSIVSVFWLVTVINAFNIIDVHDGLCASIGAVAAVFFGVFAFLGGEVVVAILCAGLAGSLIGFLRYNWAPARIYLGDTGSMLIGLLLGSLAMIDSYSTVNPAAPLFSPLAVLAVPLFDLGFVVLVRLRHRMPIYHGSPDHFAVRLRLAGRRHGAITAGAAVAGAISGGLALGVAFSGLTIALVTIALSIFGALAVLVWLWRLDPRRLESKKTAESVSTAQHVV